MFRYLIFFLLSAIFSFTNAYGEDWPTDSHDNQRTGITSEKLIPPLKLQWVFEPRFPPAKGWAMPITGYSAVKDGPNVNFDDAYRVTSVGNMAYFSASAENRIYAVDAPSGKIAWTFHTDAASRLSPTIWKGKAYVGADDGKVYCLDAKNGKPVWVFNCALVNKKVIGQERLMSLWPVRSGVLIEDGKACFTAGLFAAEGINYFVVDAETGTLILRRELSKGGRGMQVPQGYPLATKDSIFFTTRNHPLQYDRLTGEKMSFLSSEPYKWGHYGGSVRRFYYGGSYAQIWGSKIVHGQAAILCVDFEKTWQDKRKRTKKGKGIWAWFNARRILFKDEMAYLGTDYYLFAVPHKELTELSAVFNKDFYDAYRKNHIPGTTNQLREVKKVGEDSERGKAILKHITRYRDVVQMFKDFPAEVEKIVGTMRDKCAWMKPVKLTQSLIMADNVIYGGAEERIAAIDANTGEELWSEKIDSPARSLAVANGRLFASLRNGKVLCFAASPGPAKPKQVLPPVKELSTQDKYSEFYKKTAEDIVANSGAAKGYCLILNDTNARLACELVKCSDLTIQVLLADDAEVPAVRKTLAEAGLYGGRICVSVGSLPSVSYPPYIFNVVVDASAFFGGKSDTSADEIFRITKPNGGVAFIGQPAGASGLGGSFKGNNLKAALRKFEKENAEVNVTDNWARITRGDIEGGQDWTHHFANAANTWSNEDKLVKGPFGILWFGEPGPLKRIERHANGPVPLVVNGVMFLMGYDLLMAYDIYNGVQYWERRIAGVTRRYVPKGTCSIAADEDSLYVLVENNKCLRLDASTGETVKDYPKPKGGDAKHQWIWIAREGDTLYGSLGEKRRGKHGQASCNSVFALDVETGKFKWMYIGKDIDHASITVGGEIIFLVDRNISDEEKETALGNTIKDESVEDRKAVDKKGNPILPDLRKIVALDVNTGEKIWEKPFNMTDITLDDKAAVDVPVPVVGMYKDNIFVVCGSGSFGHMHKTFVKGGFKRRAMYAFDAKTGEYLWGGRKNYRKRPLIAGDYIYAEPFAWHLKTGKIKKTRNPLSDKEDILDFHRGYIGCGHMLASGAALFGSIRGSSGKVDVGYYNLDDEEGFGTFSGITFACGIGAVPANGVFVVPEGRSGCTCHSPIYTSIVLYPKKKSNAWGSGAPGGIADAKPNPLPVKHMYVNLGAPGLKRDDKNNIWIPYLQKGVYLQGITGKWMPTYRHKEEQFYYKSPNLITIKGTDKPWIYTSGYHDSKNMSFTLRGKEDGPAEYTVRLHFAEIEDVKEGERIFDVFLQGKPVLTSFDIVKETGESNKALVKEFKGVSISGNVTVNMKSAEGSKVGKPILCAIEAILETK